MPISVSRLFFYVMVFTLGSSFQKKQNMNNRHWQVEDRLLVCQKKTIQRTGLLLSVLVRLNDYDSTDRPTVVAKKNKPDRQGTPLAPLWRLLPCRLLAALRSLPQPNKRRRWADGLQPHKSYKRNTTQQNKTQHNKNTLQYDERSLTDTSNYFNTHTHTHTTKTPPPTT